MVATPIGNLQDLSGRAISVLAAADILACEDTRHTQKLLNHLGIKAKTVSYHEHNEGERSAELLAELEAGRDVAIVSDAGTPGISDPGFRIVRLAADAGISVIPVPGPVAFVNAVIASGLPADSIFFGGFLPSKRSDRLRRLREVRDIPATLSFYETPHRLSASLADCLEVLGDREAAVARELTKLHEEIVRGSLKDLSQRFSSAKTKGEIVFVIDRARSSKVQSDERGSFADRVEQLEVEGMDRKEAMKAAAKEFGLTRSEAYRKLQAAKKN